MIINIGTETWWGKILSIHLSCSMYWLIIIIFIQYRYKHPDTILRYSTIISNIYEDVIKDVVPYSISTCYRTIALYRTKLISNI